MDLIKLREDEDAVVELLRPLSRLRQLIALNYLNKVLNVRREDIGRDIYKEFHKKSQE